MPRDACRCVAQISVPEDSACRHAKDQGRPQFDERWLGLFLDPTSEPTVLAPFGSPLIVNSSLIFFVLHPCRERVFSARGNGGKNETNGAE